MFESGDFVLTVVNLPPDLATIIAPDGAVVRTVPSTRYAMEATAKKSDLNIV